MVNSSLWLKDKHKENLFTKAFSFRRDDPALLSTPIQLKQLPQAAPSGGLCLKNCINLLVYGRYRQDNVYTIQINLDVLNLTGSNVLL